MRKNIPKSLREFILNRDGRKCICCLEKQNLIIHHLQPVKLNGSNNSKNLITLCKHHHELLHLADIQTIMTVAEHLYYTRYRKFHSSLEELHELIGEYFEINQKTTS